MEDVTTGTPNTWSWIECLNIAYWTVVLSLLSQQLRIALTTFLIKTRNALLLAWKSTAWVSTWLDFRAGWLRQILTILLIANVFKCPDATFRVYLHHNITTISAFFHLGELFELLATFANVVWCSTASFTLFSFAVDAGKTILRVMFHHCWT